MLCCLLHWIENNINAVMTLCHWLVKNESIYSNNGVKTLALAPFYFPQAVYSTVKEKASADSNSKYHWINTNIPAERQEPILKDVAIIDNYTKGRVQRWETPYRRRGNLKMATHDQWAHWSNTEAIRSDMSEVISMSALERMIPGRRRGEHVRFCGGDLWKATGNT